MSFLELPTELHISVEVMIAIPKTAPFSVYQGFYMSCRQIKSEMDSECSKVFEEYLSSLHSSFRARDTAWPVQPAIPETYSAMQHILIVFHRSMLTPCPTQELLCLTGLRITSLSLVPIIAAVPPNEIAEVQVLDRRILHFTSVWPVLALRNHKR
jgi:hypothetical protein